MKQRIKALILRSLRVPPEPTPPSGAPGSLRVFRAGKNFWYLRLISWGGKQSGALLGIFISVAFIQEASWQLRAAEAREAAADAPEATVVLPEREGLAYLTGRYAPGFFRGIATNIPESLLRWLRIGEAFAIAGFLIQLPVTFLLTRLDYAYRWYLVTDRSLRLRHGLFTVHESTMSFANIQQVEVLRGPLQSLLGLADLRVRSAGGGGGDDGSKKEHGGLHQSLFHAVDNAEEIRDLILARLRHFRSVGLGDHDEKTAAPLSPDAPDAALVEAIRAFAAEARAVGTTVR